MEYEVLDIPKFVDIKVYDEYIDKYVRKAKSIKDVVSIYQMGSISNPGISDIDLIVIVEDNFNVVEYQKLSVRNIFKNDSIANYLFIHDVMILDKKSFKNIQYINYCTNLKLLYGKDIEFTSLSKEESKVVQFSIIVDFIISRLHQFENFKQNKVFFVRGNIVRASSLKHSIKLAENIGIEFDSNNILKYMMDIRNNWFKDEDINKVQEYFDKSIKYFYELILACAEYFEKEFLLFHENSYKDSLMILSDNKSLTVFTEKKNVINYYKSGLNDNIYKALNLISNNSTLILYPRELYFHYLTYSRTYNNNVSMKINNKLINNNILFEVSDIYKKTMQNRADAISASSQFIINNKLYFSNSAGYPGFNML